MFKRTRTPNHNHTATLLSPVTGDLVSLSKVPDLLHARRVLGPGVAIAPEDGLFVAPLDGVVRTSPRTPHAYWIRSEDTLAGAPLEILVLVGTDSSRAQGPAVTPLVADGQRVAAGQPLCRADLEILEAQTSSTLSPVVITVCPEGTAINLGTAHATAGSTPLVRLTAA
ncbi:PTS sugar transporter subunit IIA [Rothia kristinae]|uniref:PTS sugar transporter subunit IIA n=1 Tax=Rothia kristinae TaxID=37923 RepID=UPI0007734176|nr:PTS glucose transporter subunit IIA [Rothia kristinae]